MILWCSKESKLTPHFYVGLRTMNGQTCIEAKCECGAAGHFVCGKTGKEALAWVREQE